MSAGDSERPAQPVSKVPHPSQFRATASVVPPMSNRCTVGWWLVMIVVLVGLLVAYGSGLLPGVPSALIIAPLLIAPFVFMSFQMRGSGWMSRSKPIGIALSGNGLTVDRYPKSVFGFADLVLGQWNSMTAGGVAQGLALHLHSDGASFVIGADCHRRDDLRRDAPPVEYPDVTMDSVEFDRLLAAIGSRAPSLTPLSGRATARCVLVRCPAWFFPDTVSGMAASVGKQFTRAFGAQALAAKPSLTIDVDKDWVTVSSPGSDAAITSVGATQVTATAASHVYYRKSGCGCR